MSVVDKQRVTVVATFKAVGYTFSPPAGTTPGTTFCATESDAMHGVLMSRADALQGCAEGPPEEAELQRIVEAIEAYERRRWPDGKEPGGKG
jgi:hypothetical protein